MKKSILAGAVLLFSVMLFASCKKDYTCEVAGATVTYNDLDKAEADAAQTSCENVSGTWSVK